MYIIIWKKKVCGPSESLKGQKKKKKNLTIKFYYILNNFKSLIINKHLIEIVQVKYPLKKAIKLYDKKNYI